jgi:threonine/homoserine/homoserine lactone efflux protein
VSGWSLFLVASLILAVTPGPGVLYIVARTAANGLKAGIVSVFAVASGNLGGAVAATLGLAAIFRVSSAAFALARLAGAGYLIYLAITTLRAARPTSSGVDDGAPVTLGSVYKDGVVVSLFNPKTALFFAAFLPQFVTPGTGAVRQCIALGAKFVVIAMCTDSIYAVATAAARAHLTRLAPGSRAGSYLAAGVYASLGLYAALSGTSGAK